MADVEMKPAADGPKDTTEEIKAPPALPSPATEIKGNAILIDRGVSTLEPRFTHRALRSLAALRKRITPEILKNVTLELCPKGIGNLGHGNSPITDIH